MCSALLLYINVHARTHTHTHSSWTSILWSWNSVQQSPWEANSTRLVKKFPEFYGAQKFITWFTEAGHLLLSSAIWMSPRHPVLFIENSHLGRGLPSDLFSTDFPTEISCTSSPLHTCHMKRAYSCWWGLVRSTTTDHTACHYAIIIDCK